MCHTSGSKGAFTIKKDLGNKNIKVVGWVVLDPVCHLNNVKRLIREHEHEVDNAEQVYLIKIKNRDE